MVSTFIKNIYTDITLALGDILEVINPCLEWNEPNS